MPTPNDYSDIRFGDSNSTGHQHAPAKEYGQVEPSSTLPGPEAGNYPHTFHEGFGESHELENGNYPGNYTRVDFGGDHTSSYKKRSSEGVYGNFETARPEVGLEPEVGEHLVPNPVRSKQFSSDVNGNPEALLRTTEENIRQHADMNAAYGLTQPVATLGSHPWLRDQCTNVSTEEPGNAVPDEKRGIPLLRTGTNK